MMTTPFLFYSRYCAIRLVLTAVWVTSLPSFFSVRGARVNTTIDDGFSGGKGIGLSFQPSNLWNVGTECSQCLIKPDPSQALDGSWHDTTYDTDLSTEAQPYINFTFTGNGIYAYCIIPNTVNNPTQIPTKADYTFYLDGKQVGAYLHVPDSSTNFEYRVPVYGNGNIPDGLHTFSLFVNPGSGQDSTAILFDYFVYTSGNDDSPLSSATQTKSSATAAVASAHSQVSSSIAESSAVALSSISSSSPSSAAAVHNIGTPSSVQSSAGSDETAFVNTNAKTNSNLGMIAGSVLGGVICVALILVLAIIFRRRKRRTTPDEQWKSRIPAMNAFKSGSREPLVQQFNSPARIIPFSLKEDRSTTGPSSYYVNNSLTNSQPVYNTIESSNSASHTTRTTDQSPTSAVPSALPTFDLNQMRNLPPPPSQLEPYCDGLGSATDSPFASDYSVGMPITQTFELESRVKELEATLIRRQKITDEAQRIGEEAERRDAELEEMRGQITLLNAEVERLRQREREREERDAAPPEYPGTPGWIHR